MRTLSHLAVAGVLVAGLAAPARADAPSSAMPAATSATAAALIDPVVVLDAARARVAAGDTAGAIAGLVPYVAAHPEDLAAGRLLGDLYFRIPDYRRAEAAWRSVLAVAPADRETHSRLGSLYAAEDRVNAAIDEFQKSLPTRSGYLGLIAAHKQAGDLPQYLSKLESAATATPLDPSVWAELGQVRWALHQLPEAFEAFSRELAIRNGSCAARVDIANVLVDMHRPDEAIENLKFCIDRVDASYYPAVVNLGEAYLEKGDYASARPILDRALKLRPEGTEALVDIGYVYDEEGDWKTAIAYYNRAIRADPMRPEAYIDLGYDYNAHRFYPLAEAAFIKGISVAADDGRLHYLLAVTYNLQGKIPLAREEYHEALTSGEPDVARAARAELALLPPP
jgi:tetratricopeptide (TPR) repeat protein